jgi:hypothetical protein
MKYERRIASVHVHTGAVGWVVRLSGRRRALRRYHTKPPAISAGRSHARLLGVPLIVHRRDGTVQMVVS